MSDKDMKVLDRPASDKAKALRREGIIPGVIYGGSMEKPLSIKVPEIDMARLLNNNAKSTLLSLNLKGKKHTCMVKEVQKDFLSNSLIHVDFQAVKSGDVIKLNLPITFEGRESIEYKQLILEILQGDIEIQAPANKLPSELTIDISSLEYNDKIYAKDIELPKSVELVTEEDTLIALANKPAITEEVDASEDENASSGEGGDLAPGQEIEQETKNDKSVGKSAQEPAEGKA